MRADLTQGVPPGPRSRYPGDLVLRFRRDVLGFLAQTAREYGDVVAFPGARHKFFILNHPDGVRDVLVTYDDHFIKGPALRRAKPTLGEGLLTSEGDLHKRQRRLAQPALHPNRVAAYADVMARYAKETCDAWRDGQTIALHEQMMKLTLRIVAKTLFDADVAAEVDEIGSAVGVMVGMFTRTMSPWGPLLDRLPLPSNFRFRRAERLVRQTLERFIRERHRDASPRDDLLSRLLGALDTEGDGRGMSDKQLRDELITLFTAGHETTANALTFTLWLLAQHPNVERKLWAEVDEVLGDRLPGAEDVDRLPYCRMVLSESMRLYPPAWAVGREAVKPVPIGPYTIPENAVVLVSQWVVHRDPRWWPDPLRFDPERFSPEQRASRPRWAYFPFGGGSRGCIGESFAWMEATLALATIVRRWRMERVSQEPIALRPTITLRPKNEIPMIARGRQIRSDITEEQCHPERSEGTLLWETQPR